MKKLYIILSLICILFGCQQVKEEDMNAETMNTIYGKVVESIQEEDISMVTIENDNGLTILTFDENCILFDAQDKYPILLSDLETNTNVKAYISNAMTLSEPPKVNASIILSHVDKESPDYIVVKEVEEQEDSIRITSSEEKVYSIPKDSQFSPYRTKNIVTYKDIHKGSKCIIWPENVFILIFE